MVLYEKIMIINKFYKSGFQVDVRKSTVIVNTTWNSRYTRMVLWSLLCSRGFQNKLVLIRLNIIKPACPKRIGFVCTYNTAVIDGQPPYHRIPISNALWRTPKGILFCFFITAEVRVNYAIKVSINGGGDEFDTLDRIMNSSKDIVCKLISHIPVIMVTLGDKGLLVCIM